jgi:hypothetical protein
MRTGSATASISCVTSAARSRKIVVVAAGVVETQDRAGILGNQDGYAPPWIFERETALYEGRRHRARADARRCRSSRTTSMRCTGW